MIRTYIAVVSQTSSAQTSRRANEHNANFEGPSYSLLVPRTVRSVESGAAACAPLQTRYQTPGRGSPWPTVRIRSLVSTYQRASGVLATNIRHWTRRRSGRRGQELARVSSRTRLGACLRVCASNLNALHYKMYEMRVPTSFVGTRMTRMTKTIILGKVLRQTREMKVIREKTHHETVDVACSGSESGKTVPGYLESSRPGARSHQITNKQKGNMTTLGMVKP